jgi:hypothetical protein
MSGMPAVAAVHGHVQQGTGEQEQEGQKAQQMDAVFAEEQIDEHRTERGDRQAAEQRARAGLVSGHFGFPSG